MASTPVGAALLNLLDEQNNLEPTKTEQAILRLRRDVSRLILIVRELQSAGGGVTVTGSAGIVFVDTTLTANHAVSLPTVPDDSILVYTFLGGAGSPWVVTWPAEFLQQPQVTLIVGQEMVCIFRKRGGGSPTFSLIVNPTRHGP